MRAPGARSPFPETAGALLLGLLVAVLTRRPEHLSTRVPLDAGDPVLVSWVLAWPAHALRTGQDLFDGNPFAPLRDSYAFTDLLLGYLPFGLVGSGPQAAVVRYNVVLLVATALAFTGAWVLVRQLGLGRAPALVAAVAFAVNPWRVSQLGHLQVLSTAGIPLALAMLARGHGLRLRAGRARVRPGWVLAGWATATWQVSLGFGVGIQLIYLLAVLTAVAVVRGLHAALTGAHRPARRLLAAHGAGLVLFLGTSAALAVPYFQVVHDHPNSRRTAADLEKFSPTVASLVTAPAESLVWGRLSEQRRRDVVAVNEKELFPGLAVVGLAVVGLGRGVWSRRRIVLLVGTVVVVTAFALGTNGPLGGELYLQLFEHAPGWQGVRTPGRLVTTGWLALVLLAAHGVSVLQRATGLGPTASRRPAALALGAGLAALVLLEGLDTAGLAVVPPAPPGVRLADLPAPVMVLPSDGRHDQRIMNWSTDGFPRVVNGVSGFTPTVTDELRAAAAALPAPAALQMLRDDGVRSLVLLPGQLAGTPYAAIDLGALAAAPGVTVERRGETVVVTL